MTFSAALKTIGEYLPNATAADHAALQAIAALYRAERSGGKQGRPRKTVTCPRCQATVDGAAYLRYQHPRECTGRP